MIENNRNCFKNIVDINPIYIVKNAPLSEKFTIAIPTYKRVHTLKETIDSIINQNHNKYQFNILISDNNSIRNDETEIFVINHYSHISGLSYCKYSKNMNVADHWNKLFEICPTDYLIMLHDDDVALPNFFNDLLDVLKDNVDASYLKCGAYDWIGGPVAIVNNKSYLYKHTLHSLFDHFSLSPTGCLIKVKDIIEIGGYDNSWGPAIDYDIVLRLLLKGKSIYKASKISMLYRRVNNDSSNPDTQLQLCEMDLKIKDRFGKILSLPRWYISLSKWFCRGSHLYYYSFLVSKKKSFSYRCFFLLHNIWNWIHKLYFNKSTRVA